MGISRDKLVKSHMERPGNGYKREIFKRETKSLIKAA